MHGLIEQAHMELEKELLSLLLVAQQILHHYPL
jgi:hypothetical protein